MSDKFPKNIIIPILLFTAVLLIAFYPPVQAAAQETAAVGSKPLIQAVNEADCGGALNVLGVCIGRAFAWVIFWILAAVAKLFSVFGLLFDAVAAFTLNPANYDFAPLRDGWTIIRDTANLFFIFILLFIAIATILQIETYGAKRFLPKLITAAIFINFSFVATQYIIYSSNLFTGFFLPGAFNGATTGFLSEKFAAGINPNAMFASFESRMETADLEAKLDQTRSELAGFEGISELTPEQIAESNKLSRELSANREKLQKLINDPNNKSPHNTVTQLIIVMLGVLVFLVIAMFVLAVAAVLLVIRTVVLWFLLVLSPIAFIAPAFPGGLGGAGKNWWDQLLKQSFFLPAFFFMFLVSVNMIAQFPKTFGQNQSFIDNWQMVMFYALSVAMMLASLTIAQKIGAVGAAQAQKYVKSALKYGAGYAAGYAGKIGRRYGAPIAKELATSDAASAKLLRRIPFLTRGLGQITAKAREDVDGAKKKYEKYSDSELKNLSTQFGTSREGRIAIAEILAGHKNLKTEGNFTGKHISGSASMAKGIGRNTKDIDNLLYQYAQTPEEWRRVGEKITPAQIADLSGSFFENRDAMDALVSKGNIRHMQSIVESRNAQETAAFFGHLSARSGGNSIQQIAARLRNVGNDTLASQLEADGPHKALLGSYVNYGGGGGGQQRQQAGFRGPNP